MIARLYQTEFIVVTAYICVALVVVPQTIYCYTPLLAPDTIRTTGSFQITQSNRDQFNDPYILSVFGRSTTRIYSTDNGRRNRRRRKNISGDNDANVESDNFTLNEYDSDTSNMSTNGRAELPDFDVSDDDEDLTVTTAISSERSPSNSNIGPITPNMMASPSTRNGNIDTTILSVDELRDRSLEKKLESLFTEDIKADEDNVLPDFVRIQKETRKNIATDQIPQSSSSLSKKQRQVLARQQQDMEQQKISKSNEKEIDSENPLSKLPFVTNEKGEIEPIKVLESATWACIFILVVWEVYINSPFFNRAAPIIPIVYDIWI